jgi:predicted ester cyclase
MTTAKHVVENRELVRRFVEAVRNGEDIVAEGDQVVAYVTIHGTPERQYGALAPTGESFDSVGFQKYRLEDGKLAEVWVLPNAMEMLRQLGIFPDSPGKVLRLVFGALKGRLLGR